MSEFKLDTTVPQDIVDVITKNNLMFSNEEGLSEILTESDYDFAVERLKTMKADVKLVVAAREEITKPLNDEKTRIINLFKPWQERCATYESKVKRLLGRYHEAVEKKRREAQAIKDAQARKERAELEARAQKHIDAGNEERAEALVESATNVTAIEVAAPVSVVKGVSQKKKWTATITDKKEFVAAAVGNPMLMAMIDIDQAKLNKFAAMLQEEFDIPGAKASAETSIAIRA